MMATSKFSPIVVGLPRSGFSLLISILNNFFNIVPNKMDTRRLLYRDFCKSFGKQISKSIIRVFNDFGLSDVMYFNPNFQYMIGGPIWNNDKPGRRAYFRKYIGAGQLGDFTIITSHPIEILDAYEVIHSHGPYHDWVDDGLFNGYTRIASVRNPLATINSASHSINALASEYIQKVRPHDDVEKMRIDLAYYKLTDLNFFKSLMDPLKRGLDDLIENRDRFYIVPWEEMVTTPQERIRKIAADLDLPVTDADCHRIWSNIGFRNLTGAHKHNYRVGKAYVGDELESMTNEHIEIMKSKGFDEVCKAFGYPELQYLDESSYTSFQANCSAAIQEGLVKDPTEDRVLFNYAFNKSNIDFKNFDFRMYDWREQTRLERSIIEEPSLEKKVSDITEEKVEVVNGLLVKLIQSEETDQRLPSDFIAEAKRLARHFPDVDVDSSLAIMKARSGIRGRIFKKLKSIGRRYLARFR